MQTVCDPQGNIIQGIKSNGTPYTYELDTYMDGTHALLISSTDEDGYEYNYPISENLSGNGIHIGADNVCIKTEYEHYIEPLIQHDAAYVVMTRKYGTFDSHAIELCMTTINTTDKN